MLHNALSFGLQPRDQSDYTTDSLLLKVATFLALIDIIPSTICQIGARCVLVCLLCVKTVINGQRGSSSIDFLLYVLGLFLLRSKLVAQIS